MELAAHVIDLANAIQSLSAVVDALASLPISSWVALVVFFLWLLVNKDPSRILGILERKQTLRLERLDAYVASSDLADTSAIRVMRDLRDAHYFKIGTGIYAENRLRNALIKLHEMTSHLVTWRHIRLALPYLEIGANESIAVRALRTSEKLGYWYNQLIAYTFLLIAATLVSLVILSGSKTLASFLIGFGGGILSALFAMFVLSQNWPVHASRRIAGELASQQRAVADA